MSVKVIRMLSHHRRYVLTFVPEFQDRKPRENEFFLSITQLEKHSMRSLLTSDFYSYFFTTLVKRERKRKLENEGISKMKIVGVETRRWMVFFCSFSVSFRRKWRQSLSFSLVQRKISKKFFHSYQFTVPIIS